MEESRLLSLTYELFLNTSVLFTYMQKNDHFQNPNPTMQTETVFSPNAAAVAEDLLLHREGTLWLAVNKDTEAVCVWLFDSSAS